MSKIDIILDEVEALAKESADEMAAAKKEAEDMKKKMDDKIAAKKQELADKKKDFNAKGKEWMMAHKGLMNLEISAITSEIEAMIDKAEKWFTSKMESAKKKIDEKTSSKKAKLQEKLEASIKEKSDDEKRISMAKIESIAKTPPKISI